MTIYLMNGIRKLWKQDTHTDVLSQRDIKECLPEAKRTRMDPTLLQKVLQDMGKGLRNTLEGSTLLAHPVKNGSHKSSE
jgi:hypothetical protein